MMELSIETAVAVLTESPDFRVLRRFVPAAAYRQPNVPGLKQGLYVDVETTGLNTETDRIIELAIQPFQYDADGNVYAVEEGEAWLEDPGIPIPPEVTAMTGISDADVAGQQIDEEAVLAALWESSLVIAHNADFDRKMVERRFAPFAKKPWACSYREVDWKAFGCVGAKLPHIMANACAAFYEAHRALDDCRAGVHVLAAAQLDGRPAMAYLLDSARKPTYRVWASGSPFSLKDALKARGYRWHDGTTGHAKSWFRDVDSVAVEAEAAWLHEQGVMCNDVQKFTAQDRYSVRAACPPLTTG